MLNDRLEIAQQSDRQSGRAFSLVEVIVAMALTATALVALLATFTHGIFNIKMARENLRATQVMLEKVETIRLYAWDQITTPGAISNTFTAYYDPNSPNAGARYAGTLKWSPVPLTVPYANQMTQLTVSITWHTDGLQRSRSFTTYVARQGLENYGF
jgi:type II secretory pathway pseudopilin PulG